MTTPDLERRIRTWFADEIGEAEAAPSSLYAFLGAIPQSMPREHGLFGRRTFVLLAAAVLLVGLLAGAIAVGSGLLKVPSILPPDPSPSAEATVQPSQAAPIGLIAYTQVDDLEPGQGDCIGGGLPSWCIVTRIWIANTDGSDARPLHPDEFTGETLFGWSQGGAHLLYLDFSGLVLGTPDGAVVWRFGDVDGSEFSLSPNGTRLAFASQNFDAPGGSVIAILDIATGEVTELDSTRTKMPVDLTQCAFSSSCEGFNDLPRWSPDGTRLAFARQTISPEVGAAWLSAILFVVDVDDTDLHRVSPEGFYAVDPHWSPDGSRLVFMNDQQIVNASHTTVERDLFDLYTVLPDGTDLRRLTSDGVSVGAEWTTDGRLTFYKIIITGDVEKYENWAMDADGSNTALLGLSLAELSAAGCTVCLYPLPVPANQGPSEAIWQPMP